MTSKERLEQYVKEDMIYNEYLDNHKNYVSDFDKFCVEHCQDIKNILKENDNLKNQQKEFVKYLKDEIKKLEKVQVSSLEEITGKDYLIALKKEILSKYKEIIGGENND